MNENTVREIMARYFETKGIQAVRQKGSGPDFLEGGNAVELKGTASDFDRATRQFVNYILTSKYKGLTVAFPHDFLNAGKLCKFGIFCQAALAIDQAVPTYLLAEDNSFYYVRKFDYGKDVLLDILKEINEQYYKVRLAAATWQKEVAKKADKDFKDLEQLLLSELRRLVQAKPDLSIPKSSIPLLEQRGYPIGPNGQPFTQKRTTKSGGE